MTERRSMKARAGVAAAMLLALGLGPLAPPLLATAALAQDAPHPLPRRGDYLPPDVLQAGPRVDYAAAHLRKPPAGYGWFQLGRVYVMASVSTGLIVEVVEA